MLTKSSLETSDLVCIEIVLELGLGQFTTKVVVDLLKRLDGFQASPTLCLQVCDLLNELIDAL